MEITDIKKVYPEFKFFKDIYTSINKTPDIIFHANNGKITFELINGDDSQYSILYGSFLTISTEFLKWIITSDCKVTATLDDINILAKCLKKNAKTIMADDNTFTFNVITKDGESKSICFTKEKDIPNLKVSNIIKQLKYSSELPNSFINKEILMVYLKDNKISDDENDEKLLEIPSKKVLSSLKNGKYTIKYSDRIGISKYVMISCTNESLCLNQIFATV